MRPYKPSLTITCAERENLCAENKNILKIKEENIAVVGDQIFTDIIGGNKCQMFTILVEPINKKDYWYTAWKRPLENKIKNKYKINQTKEKNNVF